MGFGSAFGTGVGFNLANKLTGNNSEKKYAKAAKDRAKADIRMTEAKIDAERESMQSQLSAEQRSEGLRSVMAVSLDGDAGVIASSLTNLISIIGAHSDGYDDDEDEAQEKSKRDVCAAALQKLEMGIMLLRSKGDTAMADFFQKKYVELDPDAERKAFEKQVEEIRNDGLSVVMNASFDGDATTIRNSLTNLITAANANKPGGLLSNEDPEMKKAKKEVYAAALDKIEMGIMLLQNRGDAATADFFQQKLMALDPKRKIMSMLQKKK